jgi:hypothetical protein
MRPFLLRTGYIAGRMPPKGKGSMARTIARRNLAGLALLLLASCGGGETPQPGALTRDEEQALEDAASMLDDANNEQALSTGPTNQPHARQVTRPLPRTRTAPE